MHKAIGGGGYGRVFMCSDSASGRRVAIKVFLDTQDAPREVSVYRKLADAPFPVVQLLDYDITGAQPWLAMTHFHCSTDFVRGLRGKPEDVKINGMTQVAQGVAWLHSVRVAHLYLKPGNVIWDASTNHAYLIDFGMSVETDDAGAPVGEFSHAGVTAIYRPWELWMRPISRSTNCFAVDAWSFGCVMAEVFIGKALFQ